MKVKSLRGTDKTSCLHEAQKERAHHVNFPMMVYLCSPLVHLPFYPVSFPVFVYIYFLKNIFTSQIFSWCQNKNGIWSSLKQEEYWFKKKTNNKSNTRNITILFPKKKKRNITIFTFFKKFFYKVVILIWTSLSYDSTTIKIIQRSWYDILSYYIKVKLTYEFYTCDPYSCEKNV